MQVTFKVDVRFGALVGLGGVLASYTLFAAFPALKKLVPDSSVELASWVQAIGAIAAIAYAGRNLKLQLRHSEDQRQAAWNQSMAEREMDRMKAEAASIELCEDLTKHVVAALKSLESKMNGSHPQDRAPSTSRERLEGLERALLAVLDKEIPTAAASLLLRVLTEVAYSLAAVRGVKAPYRAEEHQDQIRSCTTRRKKVQTCYGQLKSLREEAYRRIV